MSNPFKPTKKHKEIKYKEQIAIINDIVCVKLAPSPIHGVGVFALRDINKGEKLNLDSIPQLLDLPYEKFKHIEKDIRDLILGQYPLIASGSKFLYPNARFAGYLNHSDQPNVDAKEDKALKDIKKGEEVTEDYRLIPNYEKIFPWLALQKK